MPTRPNEASRISVSLRRWFSPRAILLAVGVSLICGGCNRPSPQAQKPPPENPSASPQEEPTAPAVEGQIVTHPIEGVASWYEVPADSITRKRAGADELTAAHPRLPYGTLVRVTHLGNGKTVVVRITDRLVSHGRVAIDLCKEAAEQLAMIREGSAKVRLEILPDDKHPVAAAR